MARTASKKLYRCPTCGKVAHDEQDGTGHWEQGTSQEHAEEPGWSYWTLWCSACGEVNDMQEVNDA